MANTFRPTTSAEQDLYVYEEAGSGLASKIGSIAIGATSLVSAFAFLAPADGAPTPVATVSSSNTPAPQASASAGETTDQETTAAPIAPAKSGANTAVAGVASRPHIVTSVHSSAPKHPASNPVAAAPKPSAPTSNVALGPIGGVDAGNTTAPTAAAGSGGAAGGSTGNTSSPTSATSGGGSSSSGSTGNTTSPTSAASGGGSTANGTNGGRGGEREDD